MATRGEISDQQTAKIRRIFEREIQSIRDATRISQLQSLIEANNIDGIIDLLGMDRSAFLNLEESIREAYRIGGAFTSESIGAIPVPNIGNVVLRFDLATNAAVQWVQENAATRVVEIVEDQRVMIRERIAFAVSEGINPRQSALDLVGRIDNNTGTRRGGFIGNTSRQAQSLQNARSELESLDARYFTRQLRDRRFDPVIRRSIESGEPVPVAQLNAAVTSMQNRSLRNRAETIARTESINALRAGEAESIAQAIERGEVDPQDVTKEWSGTLDSRERIDHISIEGQTRTLDQPFDLPDGSRLMFPGDGSLNAAARQVIQCRCRSIYRIDFIGRVVRLRGFR